MSDEASSSSQTPTCAKCNKSPSTTSESPDTQLKPCTMCHSVLYCSRDCKKADLKIHKKVCPQLAQEYAKTADIKMATRAPPKGGEDRGGLRKWHPQRQKGLMCAGSGRDAGVVRKAKRIGPGPFMIEKAIILRALRGRGAAALRAPGAHALGIVRDEDALK
ncbi:hypothetical protein B0A48_17943 [Cryoendolithus antarcticus]|uniref:MYND-type domain-containing protein n=1 Tax=Cryoendolithus antarcticus TaxID=1507870 RepID=A0A1V8S9M0_9PEZI|nr:hypothetical protein B0A48_17943 [Cryoendolithus antarcticus]